MTIHIDNIPRRQGPVALGVIPCRWVSKASKIGSARSVGYILYSSRGYYAPPGSCVHEWFGPGFGVGDAVTVRLDLEVNTVAFRKNGADIESPQEIQRGAEEEYCFVVEACGGGVAVTIIEIE